MLSDAIHSTRSRDIAYSTAITDVTTALLTIHAVCAIEHTPLIEARQDGIMHGNHERT
jgi:hypothetical protein